MVTKHTIICKEIGETFRGMREKAKLTQVEVAKKADMDVNYYARIERGLGNPSLVKIYSIMKALNMKSLNIK
jgi:transcriptional regulator with XRE-family HTH domain